jgi:hypothetical protein
MPKTECPNISAAAMRMRRSRKRRRDGLRCLQIELRETELDVLTRKGLLETDARNDPDAVRNCMLTSTARWVQCRDAHRA